MGIARSTYYDKPATSIDNTALVEMMAVISDCFEAYGYRRMQAALRHRGFRDCQDFRVRAAIMNPKEVLDGTTQSSPHS
ncbi:MAG: hypothetical protein LCH80_03290 [Proteobacteria bacterium]|nr:hypothetical protein [Pseudomonadota bacterium]